MGSFKLIKKSIHGGRPPGKINASLNEKLKNVEWGEYKLDDLFIIEGTKSLDSNAIEFVREGINFVGRTFENNGIQGKIEKRNFEPNKPFTITATVIGNYKYVKLQKEPYYCSQNINKLTPKSIFTIWNERVAYFLVANIQKFVSMYNGQQGGYKLGEIKNHTIKLPIKKNKIDFDFMESFIAELEAERVAELSAYLKISGLDNYELSREEEQTLKDYPNTIFEEYNVIDIFAVKNTSNILSSDIIENSGYTPYLCASAENNAVSTYIKYDKRFLEKGDCIFIGGKTFVVTYQKNDFFSNDSHNLALYLNNYNITKANQLYLVSCIYKSLSHKYSWGDSVSKTKIKKDKIYLPTKNGKPDFETMENFISAIQKLVIKDVVLYSDRKINATKIWVSSK